MDSWKKNTALFLTSQTLSLFGTMLVQFAIMWHIVLETQSGALMTIYILVAVLPTFFTSLMGGVWADRYSKKHLINLADGSIALISLAIAISLSAGIDSIVLLMITACVRALGQGVQQPAVTSLIPFIVPEDKLMKINGLNGSLQSGIYLLSPLVSASLMSLAPLQVLFLIDVLTDSIAICILYFLVKVPLTERKTDNKEKTSHFTDLIDGLKYLKHQKYLLLLVILSGLYTIFMSPLLVLFPLQITRNFGADLWRLSAAEIGQAAGMIMGGLLIGVWCFRNKVYAIGVSSVVIGILTISLGFWTNFTPYLVCIVIFGISWPYYSAPSVTLIQERVAPDYLGRVLSVFTMLFSLAMPFGMLFFGPLADIVNINQLFVGTGVVMVFLGAMYFISKTLREAGMKSNSENE
ncbi:MAG: MFS transporter [Tannerella sp.]|jgi:DHA3 family macrolide efflux protein-like MFS transporter|nr:MFS transporter [Tannerella sp.]